MPANPSSMIAGQSRKGGSLIAPSATGTISTAEAIRKSSSESSAGVNALSPYAMAAKAEDQITIATPAAAAVRPSSRWEVAATFIGVASANLHVDQRHRHTAGGEHRRPARPTRRRGARLD